MGVTMSWFLVLKSLLAICIISHLSVSSVESYACIQEKPCVNEECDPNPNTCESSKGCFSKWLELEVPPLQTIQQRGCSEDSCTGLAFSATLGGRRFSFKYDHRCCYTEHCNKELIKVSELSSEPNGVECPACFSDRGICRPVSLKCKGAETMCIKATGRAMNENQDLTEIQVMGCATKAACNLKNMTIHDNLIIDTSCVNGSPRLRPIFFVLTSLFLMKSLL